VTVLLALTHESRPRSKAQRRIPALWYPTHEYQHEQPSIVLAALPLSGLIESESNQRREQHFRRILTTEVISTTKFSGGTPTSQHAGAPALVCALGSAARGRALYASPTAATPS
jgi:hypothetical protein